MIPPCRYMVTAAFPHHSKYRTASTQHFGNVPNRTYHPRSIYWHDLSRPQRIRQIASHRASRRHYRIWQRIPHEPQCGWGLPTVRKPVRPKCNSLLSQRTAHQHRDLPPDHPAANQPPAENRQCRYRQFVSSVIAALNQYTVDLAKEQIRLAFAQAQKEVDDLHQRTREGMLTAKLNGKQIGQERGRKLIVKKAAACKESIRKYSRDFDGTLCDADCIRLIGIARNTYYKYKGNCERQYPYNRNSL